MPLEDVPCERMLLPGFCSDHGTRRHRAHDPKRIRVVPAAGVASWAAIAAVAPQAPSDPGSRGGDDSTENRATA